MPQYIAFLRGINVGGHKIIKMEALREMLTLPGIKNVTTYIQSGNVLFEAKETDEAKLATRLEHHLLKQLEYEVKLFLRTPEEIAAVIDGSPFKKLEENEVLYIFFSAAPIPKEKADALVATSNDLTKLKVSGREVYALCKKIAGTSSFSNAFVEKKIGPASARNMTTVKKLLDLATAR